MNDFVSIRVWIPQGRMAELVLADGERRPMDRDGDLVVAMVPPGTDYKISVDGGDPYPDPRSAWQPFGVHGHSRAFDAGAFTWTDADFPGVSALGAPTYELHVGTFTPEGTLDAATGKLDHLASLGIRMVELMPVHAFPGERGWGYDGVGHYAVQEVYGGPAALQRFVDAAHGRGLGVCLDVVYNHLGPSGNYLTEFAPYFTDRHMTPWGEGLDFDGEGNSAHVRAFVIDGALRWMRDFHIDAFRLDAVHQIRDDSEYHILAELSDRVAELSTELGRPLSLVAESDLNDVNMVTPVAEGGLGMTGQWADDVHHAFRTYLTGEDFGYYADFAEPGVLSHVLRHVFLHDGRWSSFRGQDWGAPVPDHVDRRRFTVYTENHDQIGNRALGDRLESFLDPGAIAAGAALLLLSPHTPMLFQGQEWGTEVPFLFFTDHGEDIGPHVAEGRRAEFAEHGWTEIYGEDFQIPDPQALATFMASKLDWSELDSAAARAMLAWYRDLLALRAAVFGDGASDQLVDCDEGAGWFRMERGPVTVVVAPFDSGADVEEVEGTVALAWGEVELAGGTAKLGPHSAAVIRSL
ncbi:MAG TPA: malto-oligosyltrehalose trehalohydrolase [Actinomycetaceae bacterium]|nr:malto-oligosyltrehalose trehalohydrolase [Actinomycetaceae bacterium]